MSTIGTLSGSYVVLRGFPFTPAGANLGGSASFGYVQGWSSLADYPVSAYISGNFAYLMEGHSNYITVSEYKHGNSSRLIGSASFYTDS